jgi:hypothetical protein
MQFNGWYGRTALLCLFAVAPSLVAAAVALVPEWVASPQHNGEVLYDGVHLYSVPSMQSLGVHRELPPTHKAAVSADGSRLYLWNEWWNPGPGTNPSADTLYVYDLPGFTLRHTWPAFAGNRELASHTTVHPRDHVLIFGGMDWFDTETGQWTQSPESLHIDRSDSLPRVSEDGRWLSFVAHTYVEGTASGPLAVFVLDVDHPTRQTSFVYPGSQDQEWALTLVDQGATRVLIGSPDVSAYRLPAGTLLSGIALPPDILAVESIVGVNGGTLVSAIGNGPSTQQPYEQRIYRVSATGEASLMLQFPSVGEIGTLQSIGSTLLRLGMTSDSCFLGCVHQRSSMTGFTADGGPATTLFFDVGTYADGPLLVADSVFGGGGGVAQAVPVSHPIGLLALVLALILSGALRVRLVRRSAA